MIARTATLLWGMWRRDAHLVYYSLPAGLAGITISAYHSLLQWGVAPETLDVCLKGVSCASKQVNLFGVVTLPLLSLIVFVAICCLMILDKRRGDSC